MSEFDEWPRKEWPEIDRRSDSQSEQLRRAVVKGIDDYFHDKARVKRGVHMIVESVSEEMSSGAGKVLFRGARRLFWIFLIAVLVLGFGGWTAAVAFIKGVFAHG